MTPRQPIGVAACLRQIQEHFAPAPRQQQRKNLHSVLVPAETIGLNRSSSEQRLTTNTESQAQEGNERRAIKTGGVVNPDSCGTVQTLTPDQVLRLLEWGLGRGLEEDLSSVPVLAETISFDSGASDSCGTAQIPSAQEQARAEQAMSVLAAFCRGEDVFQRERRVMRPHQPWVYVAHPVWDFFDYDYKTEPRKS